MSALVIASPPASVFRPHHVLDAMRRAEPAFFGLAVLLVFSMAPTIFAMLVDQRMFLGIDIWIKPLKFEAALIVYLMTLALFALWLPAGTTARRWYRIYRAAVVVAIVVEMIWIGGAAFLGTASHFNRTPVGGVLYSAMGLAAILLTTVPMVYAWLIGRNPSTGLVPVIKEGIVVGLALVLPLTLLTAGTMASMAGHRVGGSGSDAGGLFLMGWARDAGDLRVAHFFATHAMHFVPAFGLLSAALFGRNIRLPLRLFTAAFVGLVAWTFWQALMGRPFLPNIG